MFITPEDGARIVDELKAAIEFCVLLLFQTMQRNDILTICYPISLEYCL